MRKSDLGKDFRGTRLLQLARSREILTGLRFSDICISKALDNLHILGSCEEASFMICFSMLEKAMIVKIAYACNE